MYIFNKVEEYISKYDSTKHLALFYFNEKYERIFGGVRYLMLKSNISDVYSHKYTKINQIYEIRMMIYLFKKH